MGLEQICKLVKISRVKSNSYSNQMTLTSALSISYLVYQILFGNSKPKLQPRSSSNSTSAMNGQNGNLINNGNFVVYMQICRYSLKPLFFTKIQNDIVNFALHIYSSHTKTIQINDKAVNWREGMGKAIQSRMFFSDLCFSHFRLHLNLHEKTHFHDFFFTNQQETQQ